MRGDGPGSFGDTAGRAGAEGASMTTALVYREAAAECRQNASIQKTVEMQEAWLMMADAYERVADKQPLLEDPARHSSWDRTEKKPDTEATL